MGRALTLNRNLNCLQDRWIEDIGRSNADGSFSCEDVPTYCR